MAIPVCTNPVIETSETSLFYAFEDCPTDKLPAYTPAINATGSVTFSGIGTANDEVVIGASTYVLAAAAGAPYTVLIGATANETAQNLAAAINAGAGAGTLYGAGTVANASASAGAVALGVVPLTALQGGVAGNSIVLTEDGADTSVSAFSGGVDATSSVILRQLDPNSYSTMGSTDQTVVRTPISPSKQRQRSRRLGMEASASFQLDLTHHAALPHLAVFCSTEGNFTPQTQPPTSDPGVALTAVTTSQYQAASGLDIFGAGMMVLARGFTNPDNNGIKTVNTSASGSVTVAETLVSETPPANARLDMVGFIFPVGDVDIDASGNYAKLETTLTDLRTLGLRVGMWVALGSDDTYGFANNYGYAFIHSISENELVFALTSWEAVTESGSGKTVRLFIGNFVRNEKDFDKIWNRSLLFEAQSGIGPSGNPQAEYFPGSVPETLSISMETGAFVTCDLAYQSLNHIKRTGAPGKEILPAERRAYPQDPGYLGRVDIFQQKIYILDPSTSSPTKLFAFANSVTLGIATNLTRNEALEVPGTFFISRGNFEVDASVTAFVRDLELLEAIDSDPACGYYCILAFDNRGMVMHLPETSLNSEGISREAGGVLTLPVNQPANESSYGYTLGYTQFEYLPDELMANYQG